MPKNDFFMVTRSCLLPGICKFKVQCLPLSVYKFYTVWQLLVPKQILCYILANCKEGDERLLYAVIL